MAKLIYLCLIIPIILCSLYQTTYSRQKGSLQLRLMHIDSPKSPFCRPELTDSQRIQRLVAISESRMHYLSKKNIQETMPLYQVLNKQPEIYLQDTSYYVELGLGEFDDGEYHRIYLLFDTGSEFAWTQCENSNHGFYQTEPIFPASESRTFERCSPDQCPNGQPTLSVTYGGGTTVAGYWATEKLTFPSNYVERESVNGFKFLCGMDIQHFIPAMLAGPNNMITGVLGMSKGENSLISQLGAEGIYTFSHCFERRSYRNEGTILRFGSSVLRYDDMLSTPLLSSPRTNYYYLGLIGISVDDELLNIPPEQFALQPDGSWGTVIDSGTTMTYLTPYAYVKIVSKIEDKIQANNRATHRYMNPHMDPCWLPDSVSAATEFPSLTFHFEHDANLVIEPTEVMIPYAVTDHPEADHMYCLTVKSSELGLNLIGSYHQVNQLIVYDLEHQTLSFVKSDCSVES